VSTYPGAIAFTRIRGANSCARDLVKPRIPAFEAAYMVEPLPPRYAKPDEIFIILPLTILSQNMGFAPLCLSINFEMVREARMVPKRFVLRTEVMVSAEVLWRMEECVIPDQPCIN